MIIIIIMQNKFAISRPNFIRYAEWLRRRPGHYSAIGLFSGLLLFTYIVGPHLSSPVAKYVLAGTNVTVVVELGSHYIDTMNM